LKEMRVELGNTRNQFRLGHRGEVLFDLPAAYKFGPVSVSFPVPENVSPVFAPQSG